MLAHAVLELGDADQGRLDLEARLPAVGVVVEPHGQRRALLLGGHPLTAGIAGETVGDGAGADTAAGNGGSRGYGEGRAPLLRLVAVR